MWPPGTAACFWAEDSDLSDQGDSCSLQGAGDRGRDLRRAPLQSPRAHSLVSTVPRVRNPGLAMCADAWRGGGVLGSSLCVALCAGAWRGGGRVSSRLGGRLSHASPACGCCCGALPLARGESRRGLHAAKAAAATQGARTAETQQGRVNQEFVNRGVAYRVVDAADVSSSALTEAPRTLPWTFLKFSMANVV